MFGSSKYGRILLDFAHLEGWLCILTAETCQGSADSLCGKGKYRRFQQKAWWQNESIFFAFKTRLVCTLNKASFECKQGFFLKLRLFLLRNFVLLKLLIWWHKYIKEPNCVAFWFCACAAVGVFPGGAAYAAAGGRFLACATFLLPVVGVIRFLLLNFVS